MASGLGWQGKAAGTAESGTANHGSDPQFSLFIFFNFIRFADMRKASYHVNIYQFAN
jgi:hypothetical protein